MSTTIKTLNPEYCFVNFTSNYQLLKSYSSYIELIGEFEDQLKISLDYFNAITSNDPVKNLVYFYKNLNNVEFLLLDNEFIDFWVKKFNSSIREIKERVKKDISPDSFFNDISDCVGVLMNSNYILDDSTIPFIDPFYTSSYKEPPNVIPVNLKNKLSGRTINLLKDSSKKTSTLMRLNLKSLFYITENSPPFADSLTPHQRNLVADSNFYPNINNNLATFITPLLTRYNSLYNYISFYSNIGNKEGYNSQNKDVNKQIVKNLFFSIDVEGTKVNIDLLMKKVKNVLKDATIKFILANTKTQVNDASNNVTSSINKSSGEETKKTVTPADSTNEYKQDQANNKKEVKKPEEEKKNAPQIVDANTLQNNPDVLVQQSLSTAVAPNISPSIDPGFFGQIASAGTSFSPSTDPMTIFTQAQQAKEIACNITEPTFTEPNFDFLFNQTIENIEEYLDNIQGSASFDPGELAKKLSDEFEKQIKEKFKGLYDSLFTCESDEEIV